MVEGMLPVTLTILTFIVIFLFIFFARIIFDRALTEFNDENNSENIENEW